MVTSPGGVCPQDCVEVAAGGREPRPKPSEGEAAACQLWDHPSRHPPPPCPHLSGRYPQLHKVIVRIKGIKSHDHAKKKKNFNKHY